MFARPAALTLHRFAALDRRLDHDPDQLRSRAEELLSRPPYAEVEPGPIRRALAWLGEAIARGLQVITDGLAATGTAGAWTTAIVGALVLALVIWRLTRGATLDRHAPEVPASTPTRTAAAWRREAEEHEAAGRSREAVRCWYATLVVALAERGVVEDVPGRTVRELDAEVARLAPRLHTAVTTAGERFDEVVYGGRSATQDDLRTVRRAADEIAGVPA